jgi:hypothetical protein
MMIKSKRVRWAGHVARIGDDKHVHHCKLEPEVDRPSCKWEDNIEMGLNEMYIGLR